MLRLGQSYDAAIIGMETFLSTRLESLGGPCHGRLFLLPKIRLLVELGALVPALLIDLVRMDNYCSLYDSHGRILEAFPILDEYL